MKNRDSIIALLRENVPYKVIQTRLGCSRGTIAYHAKLLNAGLTHPGAGKRYDWNEVQLYYDKGHTVGDCMTRFGFTFVAWRSAVLSGRIKTASPELSTSFERYDWSVVQAFYDEGHGPKECIDRFGFAKATWYRATATGRIKRDVSRKKGAKSTTYLIPFDDLLIADRKTSRSHIKRRLLNEGLLANRCYQCGLTDWMGKPLSLELHHRNGDGSDYRLDNLEMLCPNCHSQTPTWGGRNRKRNDYSVKS
jgi:5-methylcytosine-specific restriction endonuclease McrA